MHNEPQTESLLELIRTNKLTTIHLLRILKNFGKNADIQRETTSRIDFKNLSPKEKRTFSSFYSGGKDFTAILVETLTKQSFSNPEIFEFMHEDASFPDVKYLFNYFKEISSFEDLLTYATILNYQDFWNEFENIPKFQKLTKNKLLSLKVKTEKLGRNFRGWPVLLTTGKMNVNEIVEGFRSFSYWETAEAIVRGMEKIKIDEKFSTDLYKAMMSFEWGSRKDIVMVALIKKGYINDDMLFPLAEEAMNDHVWEATFAASKKPYNKLQDYANNSSHEYIWSGFIRLGKMPLEDAFQKTLQMNKYFVYKALIETYDLSLENYRAILSKTDEFPSELMAEKFPWEQFSLKECLVLAKSHYKFPPAFIQKKTMTIDELMKVGFEFKYHWDIISTKIKSL